MPRNQVEIIRRDGKFVVITTEYGQVFEREFDFEEHAHSWADGQEIRLRFEEHKQKTDH